MDTIDVLQLAQKAAWAIGGFAIATVIALLKNKTKVLPYYVEHHRVGLTTKGSPFGDIKVMLGDNAVSNLWLSEITLENETLSDFDNLVVKVIPTEARMLHGVAYLNGSKNSLAVTSDFDKKVAYGAGETPTQAQKEIYWSSREYNLPVFNRGSRLVVQVLTSAQDPSRSPVVWLDIPHKGMRAQFRVKNTVVDGSKIKAALVWGASITLPVIGLVLWTAGTAWFLVLIAFLIGAGSGAIGLAARWFAGKVRTIVAM